MKEVRVDCVGLPLGLRCLAYETIEELDAAAGGKGNPPKKGAALGYANELLIQKGALVEGRDALSTTVEALTKLAWKMKEVVVKRDGKDEKKSVPDETDREYLNRFRAAVVSGEITVNEGAITVEVLSPDGKVVTENGKPKVAVKGMATKLDKPNKEAVDNWLQVVADILGPFAADACKPDRVPREKKLADMYVAAARRIVVENKSTKKWLKTFADEGIPVNLAPNADDAATINAIGWAIKEREDRVQKEKTAKYA
jgi:hypothetical protein